MNCFIPAVILVMLRVSIDIILVVYSMLDVYFRLHGDESSFFMPDDMELSVRTLRWIVMKYVNIAR